MFVGFIDFIVDPSFAVMTDMLEKVLTPLHQQNTRNIDQAISEEVFEKADRSTSTTSLHSTSNSTTSSRVSSPRTPTSSQSLGKFSCFLCPPKMKWCNCINIWMELKAAQCF